MQRPTTVPLRIEMHTDARCTRRATIGQVGIIGQNNSASRWYSMGLAKRLLEQKLDSALESFDSEYWPLRDIHYIQSIYRQSESENSRIPSQVKGVEEEVKPESS